METFRDILIQIKQFLEVPLVKLGSTPVTLWTIIQLVVLVGLLFYLSGKLRGWIVDQFLTRTRMELGTRQATGSIIRYTIIAIGFIIILQTAGIDLTTLNVLAGAVGIGVGFGLQNIVNNLVCGILILFERPIKVGDRIVVGNVEGDVVHIGGRSTTVVTNDNITIIVPNSKFITENVVNWSHNERKVRFRIPVSVAYESDVQQVERLLLDVAAANPDVLEKPAPGVRLMEFGDNGLNFELRVWSTTLIHRRGLLTSNLNYAVYRSFVEHGIEIPFPRRDVRVLRETRQAEPFDGNGSS
ncbi:mechanosensitive ion channel family protein [Geobacter grbiciae]|uniref:mechanosensitive ion channel family protein n=1 Tax=Geobacter grbiciae TaxID=155042 RepID=UPI001C01607A|nr:mechanosensitive ion channel domain-containing protein [Geobacter grbiciae]MBT1075700.1 mechanosensitive ion channel [Geobacter grbiciae]